ALRASRPKARGARAGACSERAKRGARKDKRLPVQPKKARPPPPRRHHTNLTDWHARRRRLPTQCFDFVRWHAGQNLIVVAAGEDGFYQRWLLGEGCARASGERNARHLDFCIDGGGAAELDEISGEAVGQVHGRGSV